MKAIAFAAIAFFVLLVYSPSLMHVPRADQIMYLAEVAHKSSWWDLTAGCVDLNRHRQFNPGDELLFRPVDYFLLGSEKYFFGYNFLLWQAVGIVLHLAVVWSLLGLLLTLNVGWPAVFFTAFFSLLFVNMEMVVWHHINSYMIFIVCILAALRNFYIEKYMAVSLWMLLAAFTHEMGSITALVFAAVLWFTRPQQRKWVLYLIAVPVIYAAASLLNAWTHPFTFTKSLPPAFPAGPWQTFTNWLYALGAWAYAGLFPGELEWTMGARDMIAAGETHLIKPLRLEHWQTLLAAAAVGVYISLLFPRKQESSSRTTVSFIAFIFAFIFAGIIALGRGSQIMMTDVLRVNTYYMYIFWVFVLVGLYAAVDWSSTGVGRKRLLCIFVAVLMVYNACKLYAANETQARGNNEVLVLVKTVEMLVKEKGHEPGFSFYVDPRYPGNYIYKELRRWDEPLREYSFMEVLYPQYFTSQNPKYRFLTTPTP